MYWPLSPGIYSTLYGPCLARTLKRGSYLGRKFFLGGGAFFNTRAWWMVCWDFPIFWVVHGPSLNQWPAEKKQIQTKFSRPLAMGLHIFFFLHEKVCPILLDYWGVFVGFFFIDKVDPWPPTRGKLERNVDAPRSKAWQTPGGGGGGGVLTVVCRNSGCCSVKELGFPTFCSVHLRPKHRQVYWIIRSRLRPTSVEVVGL